MSSPTGTVYDRIGIGYAAVRRPDSRLAAVVDSGLGEAASVVNVGAGAGSYEPIGRLVVAVEPSAVMLSQHPGGRLVQATAEALPFQTGTFDAAMAIMTIHHWPDLREGLGELRRVAERQVVFTWDPGWERELWIVDEYLPEIGRFERSRFAPLDQVVELLGAHTVVPFPIPWDFADGYQPAFWRRPAAYLDPAVRAASSTFASLPAGVVEPAIERLRHDLDSGVWYERHQDLLDSEAIDYGYRLVIAG
jgi:SAM-dependent methyltransferase